MYNNGTSVRETSLMPALQILLPSVFSPHSSSIQELGHDLIILSPSLLAEGVPPFRNAASASSQARPAPTPNPTHAGHALRLNKRTEKTTPKDRPRVERMRNEEIA